MIDWARWRAIGEGYASSGLWWADDDDDDLMIYSKKVCNKSILVFQLVQGNVSWCISFVVEAFAIVESKQSFTGQLRHGWSKNYWLELLRVSKRTSRRRSFLYMQTLAPTNMQWVLVGNVMVRSPHLVVSAKKIFVPTVGTLIGWWW
jgi:hypothetical protein